MRIAEQDQAERYRKPDLPAEGSCMASDSFTVFFACLKCGACYSALQERCDAVQFRHFSCEHCRSVVHQWSIGYDYAGWQRRESVLPAAKGSG
jgi:hypothetical protein